MRIVTFRDSSSKLVGFGLQWGTPLNLAVYTKGKKLLGLMLNYGKQVEQLATAALANTPRELMPICEECKREVADVWCRAHGLYVCTKCLAASAKHQVCEFLSIAAKKAKAAV